MASDLQLSAIKERITETIRRNSDRGFIPYTGCDRICEEMYAILEDAGKCPDQKLAFDICIHILLRMIKLISHADTSSGMATDLIYFCQDDIGKLRRTADEAHHKYFFDTIIKTANNKVFQDWPDNGYILLKSAVNFVRDKKQAQKILETFPLLGTLYDGRPYPDQLLITYEIIKRLDGSEAADKYINGHIDVPEIRMLAVDNAFAESNYSRVEKLCREAINAKIRGELNGRPPWPYYLERLYKETCQQEKLLEIVRFILFQGDTSYFRVLKGMYVEKGIWDEQREPLWQELSRSLLDHDYASLLAREGVVHKLFDVVKNHPAYIFQYGKQLAGTFAKETYAIYESCILQEAQEATDRRKYKQVCRLIKNFAAAGAENKAIELIGHLTAIYPRRPAMLEELARVRKSI